MSPAELPLARRALADPLARSSDITASPERREGEAGSDDPDEIQAWTLSPSASSLTPSPTPAPPSASSLRQRTGKLPTSETLSPSPRTPSSPPAPTPPSASKSAGSGSEEMPAPLPRSLSRSPLLQFSAFPPPALRAAEGGFGRAAKESVAVVEARGRVEALEKRVERARQGLAAEKV